MVNFLPHDHIICQFYTLNFCFSSNLYPSFYWRGGASFVVGPLTEIAIQLACLLLDFGDITTSLHSGGNKVSDNKVIPFPLKGRMFETYPCIPSYKQYGALPLYTLLWNLWSFRVLPWPPYCQSARPQFIQPSTTSVEIQEHYHRVHSVCAALCEGVTKTVVQNSKTSGGEWDEVRGGEEPKATEH